MVIDKFTAGDDTASAALYEISNFIMHQGYIPSTLTNDIGIVKTKKRIVFSSDVGPICLPFRYASDDFTGSDVTALGNVFSNSLVLPNWIRHHLISTYLDSFVSGLRALYTSDCVNRIMVYVNRHYIGNINVFRF